MHMACLQGKVLLSEFARTGIFQAAAFGSEALQMGTDGRGRPSIFRVRYGFTLARNCFKPKMIWRMALPGAHE